jgi:hypothetical protein
MLRETPTIFGVEIDIRSNTDSLILHHDPFQDSELFEDWLNFFNHGTLILNVKEEGLESECLRLMKKYEIHDFFFLDQSFPFLKKTASQGEKRCAVRVSEYEDISTALSLTDMVEWVWVDCFSRFPLDKGKSEQLQNAGFKLCIVSPELQGRDGSSEILDFRHQIELAGIKGDAVCTKRPDLWA